MSLLRCTLSLALGAGAAGRSLLTRARTASAGVAARMPMAACAAYSTLTRRRRKELARAAAAQTRTLLEFAKLFDPMRSTRMSVAHTMEKLGWPHHSNEMISDGLSVDFTMEETFCAYEVVKADAYVEPTHPDASNIPAVASDKGIVYDTAGRAMLALTSPFPAAPPLYSNPLLGKVLDRATATRHDLIRSKGWKLVVIPQPLWALACSSPAQHYARRDLLMSLTLPLAPFEPRPTATQNVFTSSARTLEASTQRELATAAARMAARAKVRKAEKAAAEAQEAAARRAALSPRRRLQQMGLQVLPRRSSYEVGRWGQK